MSPEETSDWEPETGLNEGHSMPTTSRRRRSVRQRTLGSQSKHERGLKLRGQLTPIALQEQQQTTNKQTNKQTNNNADTGVLDEMLAVQLSGG
jgi:hypothetical protein